MVHHSQESNLQESDHKQYRVSSPKVEDLYIERQVSPWRNHNNYEEDLAPYHRPPECLFPSVELPFKTEGTEVFPTAEKQWGG